MPELPWWSHEFGFKAIFKTKKSDKSQEQAKQGQMFWHSMLFPAVFSIWEGVIKENWFGGTQ